MHTPKLVTRSVRTVAVPLLMAGVIAGVAPAVPAAAAQTGPTGSAASFSISGLPYGVAATSARNAWAAGVRKAAVNAP